MTRWPHDGPPIRSEADKRAALCVWALALMLIGSMAFASFAHCQVLPQAPATALRTAAQNASTFTQLPPAKRRGGVVLPEFWAVHAGMFAAGVWDVESTRAGLKRGCVEASPLLAGHPSGAQLYGTMFATHGAIVAVDYLIARLLRKQPRSTRNVALIIPVELSVGHAFAAMDNGKCGR